MSKENVIMVDSAREGKQKSHNKTFNNGSKDTKANKAKTKKILQNFDFTKLFGKSQAPSNLRSDSQRSKVSFRKKQD